MLNTTIRVIRVIQGVVALTHAKISHSAGLCRLLSNVSHEPPVLTLLFFCLRHYQSKTHHDEYKINQYNTQKIAKEPHPEFSRPQKHFRRPTPAEPWIPPPGGAGLQVACPGVVTSRAVTCDANLSCLPETSLAENLDGFTGTQLTISIYFIFKQHTKISSRGISVSRPRFRGTGDRTAGVTRPPGFFQEHRLPSTPETRSR